MTHLQTNIYIADCIWGQIVCLLNSSVVVMVTKRCVLIMYTHIDSMKCDCYNIYLCDYMTEAGKHQCAF